MYTFSSSMLVLHACALTFIISSSNARNEKYPVVFSAPKDALKKNPINAGDFKIAYLSKIVDENTFNFALYEEGDELIYACPADSNDKKELKELEVEVDHEMYDLAIMEKKFEDNEAKICDSKIKAHFATSVDANGKARIQSAERQELIFDAGYMFAYSMDSVKSHLREKIAHPNRGVIIPWGFPPAYSFCMNVQTFKLVWASYEIAANPETQVEDRYAQSPDTVDYDYYNVTDEEFQTHFNAVHEAFQKHKGKTYVPELHVPQEHLLFSYRPCANHYVNAEPIHKDLAPLMRVINKRILDYSAKFETDEKKPNILLIHSLTIYLGGEMQLLDSALPNYIIPEVWAKVIYHNRSKMGTVIYLHNTLEDPKERKLCPAEYRVECDFNKWAVGMNDVPELLTSQAYCCKIQPNDQLYMVLSEMPIAKNEALDINNLVAPPVQASSDSDNPDDAEK